MLKDLFQSKRKYATIKIYKDSNNEKNHKGNVKKENKEQVYLDENIWYKCEKCGEILLINDFRENLKVCPKCNSHARMGSLERIEMMIDDNTFEEYDKNISTTNPLNFPEYESKLEKARSETKLKEGVVTGRGKIHGKHCGIAAIDSRFIMGSMGSVVGEKISRLIEKSIEKKDPVIIFCASGGARMQEGMFALMQMAKTSATLGKLDEAKLPYISILTDPTTGGVTASFAMLGDIILAEPKALVAFAGPRVIEQIIKQKLPEGFQRSEFLLEKGFIDNIVERKDMKSTISNILKLHSVEGDKSE